MKIPSKNNRQMVLWMVSEALKQLPELTYYFYDKDGKKTKVKIPVKHREYAAEILQDIVNGRSHKRAPGGSGGAPPKTPKGRLLYNLQLGYHAQGMYRGKGELRRFLNREFPDIGIDALKRLEADIRRGIDPELIKL